MRKWLLLFLAILLAAGCTRQGSSAPPSLPLKELRLGYMANLTHAQAILGMHSGSFERAVGVPIVTHLFPSGSAAMQALFAGELDLLYVGPGPATNGFLRSKGEALRVIAGAASGGAVFVLREGLDPRDLRGLRLATPGLANTQDIALRSLLAENEWRTRERGGDVTVTPMAPAEMISLFARNQIDGAWVAEPWGSRLIQEAGGVLAYDERDLWPDRTFATTLLVARPDILAANRREVTAFLAVHIALTQWIQSNPDQAREQLQEALAALQGKPLPAELVAEALGRIDFRSDPMIDSVEEQARRAFDLGFLGARPPDLTGMFDLSLLQEVAP